VQSKESRAEPQDTGAGEIVVKNPYLVQAVQEFSKRMKLTPDEVVAQALNTMVEYHKQRTVQQAPPAEPADRYLARRLLDSLLDRMASGEKDITLDDLLKYKLITDLLGSDSRAGPQPQKQGGDVDELMKYAVLMKMLGGQEAMPQEFRRELENLRREFNETMRTIMEKKTFDEALEALAERFGQEIQQLREAVDEKVSELKASVPREERKEEETLDKMLARTVKEKMKDKIGELIERGLFKEEEVYTQTPAGQPQVNWAKVIDKVIQLADTFGKYYTAAKAQPPPPPGREPEILAGPPNPWPEPEPAAKPAQPAEPQRPVNNKAEQAETPPEAVEEAEAPPAEEPQYVPPEAGPALAVSEPQEQPPSPEAVMEPEPAKAPHRRKK
jgi:hypothetical protein